MKESMTGGAGNLTAAARSSANETQVWEDRTDVMWKIMSALILIVGIPNNITILIVLHRIKKHSTSYIFFYAIAIWDLVQLVDGVGGNFVAAFMGVKLKNLSIVLCVGTKYIGYSTGLITAHLLVAVTMYRAMAVIWPFRLKTMCTHKQVRLVIALIIIGPFTYKAYFPFVLHMESGKCKWSKFYTEQVYPTMTLVDASLYTYVPTILISLGNVCLIYTLSASGNRARSKSSNTSTIATVVAISLIFLVFGIPTATERVLSGNYPSLKKSPLWRFLHEFFESLFYVNNAINFFVYYPTGKEFRKETKRLFARCLGIARLRVSLEPPSRRRSETAIGSYLGSRQSPGPSIGNTFHLTTDVPCPAAAPNIIPTDDPQDNLESVEIMLMTERASNVDEYIPRDSSVEPPPDDQRATK